MDKRIIKDLYYRMVKIRKFEDKIIQHYPEQQMRCPVHLYIGQEAIATGVCAHLKKSDYLFSYHRNHGHLIAKGADIKEMFAELYGKKTGCSSGKGGSTHMVSLENSIFGTSAIVAGGIPIGTGAALAVRLQRQRQIVVIFLGDGAIEQGTFFESMNFAKLKKLPILFVCENNFYATNSSQKVRQANPDIYKIADFFSMPKALLDGNDVIQVYKKSGDFIARIRKGSGPCFIEARTYRFRTHVGPETDIEKGFRAREEVEKWMKKCPYKRFHRQILANKLLKENELLDIEHRADEEVKEAWEFAVKSPYPEKEDLRTDIY
ncbi:MAG: thiamine pyrophosphate-dependent dehydrogenase E1 component subunit alpha [Candidatus Omnitrophica bacterium]|jgi:pyruvate dehydrogenase E1 component alpha subunit|nr:thiamine pyrophosphate-dependent dehydrogenase E1 component subunit alpha [Candidatus Omnitrophota bacterium]